MAIVWTYTKSTNTAVVTGGTSGTPATFAIFVTADRAGSVTLLAAWAPNNNTKALTYQITPVELRALLISFTVASKTAEADFIFITGTDAWGAAQTESIDVTAGNGTYVTTQRFRTITNIDCSDNAAGGGTVWADGTVAVTQPQWGVIWDLGNGQYRITAKVDFGDASTSTYFTSISESVVWTGAYYRLRGAATVQLGTLTSGDTGGHSDWTTDTAYSWVGEYGEAHTLKVYASTLTFNTGVITRLGNGGVLICIDSFLVSSGGSSSQNFLIYGTSSQLIRTMIMNAYLNLGQSLNLIDTVQISFPFGGIYSGDFAVTCTGVSITNSTSTTRTYRTNGSTAALILQNCVSPLATAALVTIDTNGGYVLAQFTCDIHVIDDNGAAISGATVLCQDAGANTIFNVATNAGGNIVQQVVPYKKWLNQVKTETDYSPHVFTISKTGYQTLVIPGVTVDHPLVWTMELGPPREHSFVMVG
jgi:hypothetical protein